MKRTTFTYIIIGVALACGLALLSSCEPAQRSECAHCAGIKPICLRPLRPVCVCSRFGLDCEWGCGK